MEIDTVRIEAGYNIAFNCAQEVPMVLMLTDLFTEHQMRFTPSVASRDYLDGFGNVCTRLVAPSGLLEIGNRFIIADSGVPDLTTFPRRSNTKSISFRVTP
jgi:hypothetical protein